MDLNHFAEKEVTQAIGDQKELGNPILSLNSNEKSVLEQPQRKEISGTVVNKENQPLPGVNIVVKGTTIGIITDLKGKFTIQVPADAQSLIFSFVGMVSQEIPVGNKTVFNVILEEEAIGLDEVVVVGYGVQTKESVTGAISSVEPEKLKQSSSVSFGAALAGRISGLSAVTTTGQPGLDDPVLVLRGLSTFNDASPLIVIDGVPRDDIRSLNPSEIASVSVLKDAAATAVYGVRGANGAIIITTRRGQKGKGQLTITADQSYTTMLEKPERIGSVEWLKLQNEAAINDGKPIPWSDEIIAKYENPLAGLDPNDPDYESKKEKLLYMYPDHYWWDEYVKPFAPQTRVNANFRGGTDKVSYFVYGGFINQQGNFINEPKEKLGYDPEVKMSRYSFRANLDFKVSSSLSAFLNLSSSIESANMMSAYQSTTKDDYKTIMIKTIQEIRAMSPYFAGPTTIDGFGVPPDMPVAYPENYNHPTIFLNRFGFRRETPAVSNSSFGFNWDLGKITKGLRMTGMASFDSESSSIMMGNVQGSKYSININYDTDEFTYSEVLYADEQLWFSKTASSRYTVNLQGKIDYNRRFGKHNVGAMILGQRDYWESFGGEIPFNVIGLAGRATYDYDSRYFGEVNLGYNGSEQFAPANRFGFFPAGSIGWVVSNENFLKDNRILTFLKFRASYGKSGSDKIAAQRFLYMDNIDMASGTVAAWGYLSSMGRNHYITMGLLGNPALSWETSLKRNIGVDFGIISNLRASVDIFKDERTGILISRGLVPEFQGTPLSKIPKSNLGKVNNKGYEFELKYDHIFNKDLSLNITGNYGQYENVVVYADEPIRAEDYAHRYRTTGYPLGQQWGYLIDWESNGGYWVSQEEIDNGVPYDFGTPRVGDFKYIDVNDDGIVDDRDISPIGYSNRNPGIIYGLSLSLNYMGFDALIFFQGVSKFSGFYNGIGVTETGQSGGSFKGFHRTAWTRERFENNEKITYPALSKTTTTNHRANDFFIMDRSYTRLKNAEIGYTLPQKILQSIGMSGLRIYASGQNLFTWHKLLSDELEPESEHRLYPTTRVVTFGIEMNF